MQVAAEDRRRPGRGAAVLVDGAAQGSVADHDVVADLDALREQGHIGRNKGTNDKLVLGQAVLEVKRPPLDQIRVGQNLEIPRLIVQDHRRLAGLERRDAVIRGRGGTRDLDGGDAEEAERRVDYSLLWDIERQAEELDSGVQLLPAAGVLLFRP